MKLVITSLIIKNIGIHPRVHLSRGGATYWVGDGMTLKIINKLTALQKLIKKTKILDFDPLKSMSSYSKEKKNIKRSFKFKYLRGLNF